MNVDDNHYLKMKIQPRELYAAVPAFKAYPMLVAIKYVSRARYKGQERRDLEQAHNTLNWVMDDPEGFPLLKGTFDWENYIAQFDGETRHILDKIGGHYYEAAQFLITLRLTDLGKEKIPFLSRVRRYLFGR